MDLLTKLTKISQQQRTSNQQIQSQTSSQNQNINQNISKIKQTQSAQYNIQQKKYIYTNNNNENAVNNNNDNDDRTSFKQLISHILDGEITQIEHKNNPQIIRIKNNILLILLVLSAYGIYYLIGEFLDVLLIAYIAGIAYQQSRQSFTRIIVSQNTYIGKSQPFIKRILKILLCIFIGFILPRIKYLLSNPHKIHQIKSLTNFKQYIYSIQKTQSYIVIVCQIILGIYILYLLFSPYLKKIGKKIRPTNISCVRIIFALFTLILFIFLIIMIPTVLFREITSVGYIIQEKVQQKLGCELINYRDISQNNINNIQNNENENNIISTVNLPLCSQKFTTQNTFLRETLTQFKQQNKTLQQCLIFIQKFTQQYLSEYIKQFPTIDKNLYHYQQILCTWYSFIEKAITYSGISFSIKGNAQQLHQVFNTGTNIFKLFFGNLTWILTLLSNSIFNFTTFITVFILTTQFSQSNNTIKTIFSQNKQQLITSITNLIQATFFIVIEHFLLSVFLLQIFAITPINLILSTLLASMAMFPFFRPWLGVLIITLIKIIIVQQYYLNIIFIILYYILSQKIYSIHYRKMGLNQIITNMSVLFGIYRFGVAGIFYGPLIIITCQCVKRQLFKQQSQNKIKSWENGSISPTK